MLTRSELFGRTLEVTRLDAPDGSLWVRVAWPSPESGVWVVAFETGRLVILPREHVEGGGPGMVLRITTTLAALRQRAASARSRPATTAAPSRPRRGTSGRAEATSGGG